MLQLLPQRDVLIPNTSNPMQAAAYINSYIDSVECENMSVDISFMSIPDECYVSTVCSTYHYIKHPEGHINWFVSSIMTEKLCAPLTLGNSKFVSVN